VQECRGLILDEAANWTVVARPFDKFFNDGEGHAADLDWFTARVQEKLDGSLIPVTSYQQEWVIASSGTPDGAGEVNGVSEGTWKPSRDIELPMPTSFADYFRQVARITVGSTFDLPAIDLGGWTYLFELMGSLNRIVVQHSEAKIALLGSRHVSGVECGPEASRARLYGLTGVSFPIVRTFDIHDRETIAATFANMNPLEQEGYVVCDAQFRRLKIKNPKYVAMHHAKDGLSNRAFVEIVRTNEDAEFCAAFASFEGITDRIRDIRAKYDRLLESTRQRYLQIAHIASQKDFAAEAKPFVSSAALFQLRAGKVATPAEFYAKMPIDSLMGYLSVSTSG